jgi:tRNA threonylcarbamoyladenosine biosynthesis protein TsaE
MQHIIQNESELRTLAARLSSTLKAGDVVTLRGELGAGKTAFARALINALSPEPVDVPSPTFTLVQTYPLPAFDLWHFDLYRLEGQRDEILELGWDDARRGVILVEWPERLGGLLPRDRIEIDIMFHPESETARTVTLTPAGILKP